MIKLTLFVFLFSLSLSSFSQEKDKKVIYKYKKYEKFDFEDLNIEGDASSPGDLSISPRFRKKFKNRLPSRPNFDDEIINAIQAIR